MSVSIKRWVRTLAMILMAVLFAACHDVESKDFANMVDIQFTSGKFEIHAELLTPTSDGPHGLVIMVHGDGPAYMRYFSAIKQNFLKAGYATLIWDKPGFGKSKGNLSDKTLAEERAQILLDAINEMKSNSNIDAGDIGVWGISQAGYVIPRALHSTDDISFMILVGAAGENGIRQTAYYIYQQLICEGASEDSAKLAEQQFIGLFYAKTFDQYYDFAKPLVDDPKIRQMGFVTAMWAEDQWKAYEGDEQSFYDPISAIQNTNIPTLVFFGALDKNVNPLQGVEAYTSAFEIAGNNNSQVKLVDGADHDIIISETGCARERASRNTKGWSNYAPEYLHTMQEWLLDKSR